MEFIDKDINEVLEADIAGEQPVNSLSLAIKTLIASYKTFAITLGSMYILPDGTLLDLGDSGYGHSNVSEYLNELGLEKDYEMGKSSKLLKEMGWIRLNTKLKFIDLSETKPTEAQYEQLLRALDFMKDDIQITSKTGFKIYKNVDSDYILDRIKRYYATGVFYESLD